jgi:PAS domain S-box-containing protein
VDGLIIDHNLAFNRILGVDDAANLKGQASPNFWRNVDDRKKYVAELKTKGFITNYLAEAKTIRGDAIVVLLHSHLVRDEKGQVVRIEGTVTDYTERNRTEDALRESEEKYRGLFDNAEVGMYRSRLDGSGIVALNQRLADIFGFTKEGSSAESVGRTLTPGESFRCPSVRP